MAVGDAFKAAITKAGLDAAKESAAQLTQALREAEAAAAALNKRGPMTPQEAATAEVRRLATEARAAEQAIKGLERAQRSASAAGARDSASTERKFLAERTANMRKGVAAVAAEQKKGKAGGGKDGDGSAGAAGAPKDLKYLLKSAGVGKAAMSAVGAAGGLELTKLALGFKGMAQLSAISARTGMQVRQLFSGVDPSPVVRAADRFTQLFNKATATGAAISGLFTRAFNSLFGGIEKAEPLFFAFAEGMVGAALQIEIAYYKARLALMPLTDAIGDAIGPMIDIDSAAAAGGLALGGLAIYAGIAAAPFIPLAAAIAAAAKALQLLNEQWTKLQSEVSGSGGFAAAFKDMSQHFEGHDSSDEIGKRARAAYEASETQRGPAAGVKPPVPAGAAPEAGAAGQPTGKAYADGIAQGVGAGLPGVDAAGKKIVTTLDASTRAAGQIQSPSKLAARTGREFPAGTAKGIDDGAGMVADAAARSMVPRMDGAGAGASSMASEGPMGSPEVLALLRQIEVNTRPTMNRDAGKPHASRGGMDMRSVSRALGVPTS